MNNIPNPNHDVVIKGVVVAILGLLGVGLLSPRSLHGQEAEAGATIAQDYWYSTPNRAALALLPEGYWDDPVIFPGMDIAVRCEAALNLGRKGTQLRDRTWQAVVDA